MAFIGCFSYFQVFHRFMISFWIASKSSDSGRDVRRTYPARGLLYHGDLRGGPMIQKTEYAASFPQNSAYSAIFCADRWIMGSPGRYVRRCPDVCSAPADSENVCLPCTVRTGTPKQPIPSPWALLLSLILSANHYNTTDIQHSPLPQRGTPVRYFPI